ncbi:MAG: FKBP-type peptidyl-prolyl cis-trans isomerase [Pseudomonadota bacterium]
MRRTRLLFAFVLFLSSTGVVQAVGTSLETEAEKYSYAIGINFTQSILRQGAPLDADAVYMAMQDALGGSEPRLSADDMSAALRGEAQKAGERKRVALKENLRVGKEFMEANKANEGVVELSNGLQYKVLRSGGGDHPAPEDTVKVHYEGKLIDGREFDSSKRRGEPATFPINGVIKGWQEILPLMRVGDRWEVVIPPNLAYGAKGAGAVIGPNATLVFEIDLLGIEK